MYIYPPGLRYPCRVIGNHCTMRLVMGSSRRHVLETLRERIREIEESQHRSPAREGPQGALDALLLEGGLPSGSLVELLWSGTGTGASSLGLLIAMSACGERKTLVVVDIRKHFYPPAAARLGLDLNRSMVVRPSKQVDALIAIDQSLRCSAVGAVLAWCPRLSRLALRRFQLAAETGGGVGLLLRPATVLREPSFAVLRLFVTPIVSADVHPRIRVDVLRSRHGQSGRSLILE